MIDSIHFQLLKVIAETLAGNCSDKDCCGQECSEDKVTLKKLIEESVHHYIFPLIIDGLRLSDDPSYHSLYRNEVIRQAQKTADFLLLYEFLDSKGLHPIVTKGIVCRDLYPQPEHRPSSDEDLLIGSDEFLSYHRAMLDYGFKLIETGEGIRKASEVSYENKENHLYIEIHKSLFAADSQAYGDLNKCFDGMMNRSRTQSFYGVNIRVPDPSDHLLYLILHALKHFLYSGFGIRQVSDIVLFAEKYREEIDWGRLTDQLNRVSALNFAGALFKIGDKYLLKENHLGQYLSEWSMDQIDEEPLLADIMEGGLYGASSMTRLHSSNMTLSAAEAARGSAKSAGRPVLHSVFLPLSVMHGRYPYLKKAPFLLPVAWGQRVAHYLKETRRLPSGSSIRESAESIRLGRERVRLLEMYHII